MHQYVARGTAYKIIIFHKTARVKEKLENIAWVWVPTLIEVESKQMLYNKVTVLSAILELKPNKLFTLQQLKFLLTHTSGQLDNA